MKEETKIRPIQEDDRRGWKRAAVFRGTVRRRPRPTAEEANMSDENQDRVANNCARLECMYCEEEMCEPCRATETDGSDEDKGEAEHSRFEETVSEGYKRSNS